MSTAVQRRRGTTIAHSTFTGALGEITIDTDKDVAVVHDGVTAGGFPLAGTMFSNIFSQQQTVNVTGGAFSLDLQTNGLSRANWDITGIQTLLRQEPDTALGGIKLEKRGTTGNATAALSSGSGMSSVGFNGWDGAAFGGGVSIRAFTSEAWTGVAHGAKLFFLTTPAGSTTLTTHATLDSTALTLSVPLNMGTHLINNVVNPVAAQDAATKDYVDTAVGGGAPPFTDTTPLVKGSVTPSKLMRFEVDGFTAATTRVLTPPNADITLAGINIAQTFAEDQTFGKRILLPDTISAAVGGIYFGGVRVLHNLGSSNFFAGQSAGASTGAGAYNAFFGDHAGYYNSAGNRNSFFGQNAGRGQAVGNDNSFFGREAGKYNNGSFNSFFGSTAGSANLIGNLNSFFGQGAGVFSTGDSNTIFGAVVAYNLTSGNHNLFIGQGINAPNPTGSNQLSIGNIIFGTGVDGLLGAVSTGNIGIAVVTPHSGLQVGRSFALPYRAVAGTDTFTADDYTINATSGTFTLNLPTAVGITGRIYVAKNSGVGSITLDPAGAELIDGSATATIVAGSAFMVQSTGAGWIII